MKNVLIFILLATGILTFIFEALKPKKTIESEIRKALEEEINRTFNQEEQTDPSAEDLHQIPGENISEAQAAAEREKLKADLEAELRKEIEAEYKKTHPTPAPSPEPTPVVVETPIPPTPTPVPTIAPTPTAKPAGPTPLLSIPEMQTIISEQEAHIKRLRQDIQNIDRALATEKGRIQSWKGSIKSKYTDDTFSKTKLRSELQQIAAAQQKWLSEQRRQNRRKTSLENLEMDLKRKKSYLQEVIKTQKAS